MTADASSYKTGSCDHNNGGRTTNLLMRGALLLALLYLSGVTSILQRLVDGWIYMPLKLSARLDDEQGLRQWLSKHGLILHFDDIDFSLATVEDLNKLPLVFFEKYAVRRQFEQIWKIVRMRDDLEGHLATIRDLASFVSKERPENSIVIVDDEVPWRRSNSSPFSVPVVDDGEESDSSSSDQIVLSGDDSLLFEIES